MAVALKAHQERAPVEKRGFSVIPFRGIVLSDPYPALDDFKVGGGGNFTLLHCRNHDLG